MKKKSKKSSKLSGQMMRTHKAIMKLAEQNLSLRALVEGFIMKDPDRFFKILACLSTEEKVGLVSGNSQPFVSALLIGGKVAKSGLSWNDIDVACRLRPLSDLLTQEEKIHVLQLVESGQKASTK